MKKTNIVEGKVHGNRFGTSIKHTKLSQREALEKIIINLSTCLKIKEVHKLLGSTNSYYYDINELNHNSYQSATNTILELSELLLKTKK